MNLVIYTSLPHVGGHTIVSLKIVEMVGHYFDEVWIGAKVMPGHGMSADTVQRLRSMGCSVQELSGENGRLSLKVLLLWLKSVPTGAKTVFICIGMRYLPPLLALFVRPSHSFYYHITHDLTPETVRRLDVYRHFFSTLLFVCPATFQDFSRNRPAAGNLAWVTQASECEKLDWNGLTRADDGVFRFGFSSRLNEAKGSKLLLEFARKSRLACELHIAGEGDFREEFERLAADSTYPVKVIYHGTFLPSDRDEFISTVFAPLDCMCVPSIGDEEGFPTVVLDALQSGVPVQATRCGGLASYALQDFGPPDPLVVELVSASKFIANMEQRVRQGKITMARRIQCRDYYYEHFSDQRVKSRWIEIMHLQGSLSRRE